jgi:membrane-bound lytic murein transglycosylase A
MKKYFIVLPLVFMFIYFHGCRIFVKLPAEPVLEQLSVSEINYNTWSDDLYYEGLDQAVEQSLIYYNRLPSSHSFQYDDLIYTRDEMVSSLNLFLDIIKNPDKGSIARQIREKFLFFESKNVEGNTLFTGYYEPVLEGRLVPEDDYPEPLYGIPDDLVEVDLSLFSDKWKNEKIVGRVQGNMIVPYDSREEIVYMESLHDRAKPIVYVDGIELFFLQIQGSGLVRLQDGSLIRVNYAQKNGHPYRSIGAFMSDRILPDKMSLQSIKTYLNNHPDEVREILSHNQSYVFFRVVDEGPLGNIEVPLTAGRSIAMDNLIVPKGGLAYIETELPVFENGAIQRWKPVKRFVLVQDTGGAIRNHGRVDIYIGSGDSAGMVAGSIKNRGRSFIIVARKDFLTN